jgi:hypothetical protein
MQALILVQHSVPGPGADIADETGLVLFPELALAFGIGAAMADAFVSARLDHTHDFRDIIENGCVREVSSRQARLTEQVKDARKPAR